jgi:hypothetical protein
MRYLIFAQEKHARLPLPQLLQNARRYFSMSIDVLGEDGFDPRQADPAESRVLLEVSNPKRPYTARFEIRARHCGDSDLERARDAEARGNASGMAELAQRCPCVWELTPAAGANELAMFELCAVLASTALGPVLPPDGSTLFGVRGALERAARHVSSLG